MLCLWIVAVLPPIFLGVGGILPSHWLMLSILVIPVATVLRLILLIVNLFHLQWRAATSIVFASAAFALATFGSLEFSDELQWYTLRPYDVHRIEGSPGGSYNIHGVEWDGGNGWDVTNIMRLKRMPAPGNRSSTSGSAPANVLSKRSHRTIA